MVTFPVFVRWKDCGKFECFDDPDSLKNAFEFNDIEFEELIMWDSMGRVLNYGNDSNQCLWIAESDNFKPDLIANIKEELARNNLQISLADQLPLATVILLLKKEARRRRPQRLDFFHRVKRRGK